MKSNSEISQSKPDLQLELSSNFKSTNLLTIYKNSFRKIPRHSLKIIEKELQLFPTIDHITKPPKKQELTVLKG